MENIDEKVKGYALGTQLEVGTPHATSDGTVTEKGTLKSVDWSKRSIVLHNDIYGTDKTISLDKIRSIQSDHERLGDLWRQSQF